MKGFIGLTALFSSVITLSAWANSQSSQPEFERYHANAAASALNYLSTDEDSFKLAYRMYEPQTPPKAALIFYHSTGTHSAITYPDLARNLVKDFPLVVITPDMRGHGYSSGERGDTPSTQAMFEDVNRHIHDVKKRFPNTPIFLGGHSSGAGLVINHSSYEKATKVDGYIFLSPYMGPVAPVFRDGVKNDFIKIDFKAFAKNANKGTDAHTPAIFYNFPDDILQRYPKIVPSLTVEMSLATTAQWPYHQLRDIDKPIAMWVGEKDEGLDPEKLAYFLTNANEHAHTQILPDQNHITVVSQNHEKIGNWILQHTHQKTGLNNP